MKKILLILICLFLISGCLPGNTTNADSNYILLGNFAINDDGIYSFDRNKGLVYYYDVKTGKNVPLCEKPVCNHDTEDCIAFSLGHYKGDTILGSQPMYFDGSLYLFYEKYMDNNYLCRANVDGSNRKLVATIENETPLLVQNFLMYQNVAVFTSELIKEKTGSSPNSEFIIKSIDLSSGKITNLNFDNNPKNFYNEIGAYKDSIYFGVYNEDNTRGIYEYNLKTEKGEYIVNNATYMLSSFVYDGHIFYPDFDAQCIYDYNLDEKKCIKIADINNLGAKEDMQPFIYRGRLIALKEYNGDKLINIQYYDCIGKKFIHSEETIIDVYKDQYLIQKVIENEINFELKDM